MTAATAPKEKSMVQILRERDTALLDVKLTLEEFAKLVTVRYDDRWRFHDWRVEGDKENLSYWIYDHIIRDKENNAKITDEQVIECAYNHFRAIQERRGQLNFHSVYIQDWEEIEVVPRKDYREYATVRVVKDRVDGLYRFSTDYTVGNGGSSYAPSFGKKEKVMDDRNEAILLGAREIAEWVKKGWEYKNSENQVYRKFVKKIETFIEKFEAEIRQPSLFW